MKNKLVRILGLKGSWKWAVKQMKKGYYVRPESASGAIKYRLSPDNQYRIEWDFTGYHAHPENYKWENANLFLSDFKRTDYNIVSYKKHINFIPKPV